MTLVFRPPVLGSEGAGRMARMVCVAREAAAAFAAATLTRVEVVPRG